jgi:hypothetical protein
LVIGGRRREKKRVECGLKNWLKGVLYPGERTCPVNGPDLFGGTPDQTCSVKGWTCLVRFGFSDSEYDLESLDRYNLVVRP